MRPSCLMVQGTTSDAGKSILVTAICRILARKGIAVAPFKPQNMALNSAVTIEGGEIGRAQAVQAEACFLKPSNLMNPVLLKPNSDIGAQVIVLGQVRGNLNAKVYHEKKPSLLNEVIEAFSTLQQSYGTVIIEGAGSPAEINLRERDIANMGFAEAVDCPVIIIADIDRGGVLAHLVGTYELLSDSEKARIKGFVINRFRGDIELLQPGIDWLEQRLSVPVLGVIPYIHHLAIDAEDALDFGQQTPQQGALKVRAIVYPRAGNHNDMDALRAHPWVDFQWVNQASDIKGADLVILLGSKSVRDDLAWLKQQGFVDALQGHLRYGGKVIGICGGFQMLGKAVHDPDGLESEAGTSEALGFLDLTTRLEKHKILRDVKGSLVNHAASVTGYEIHMGRSQGAALERPVFSLYDVKQPEAHYYDGAISLDNQVLGTYVHGLFDDTACRDYLLNWAGLSIEPEFDYQAIREQAFERLADEVEKAIPLATWQALLSGA